MVRRGEQTPDAITKGTNILRDIILAQEPGSHLGSEAELMSRLGLSRPTFLQIARIMQREQLLEVRRGRTGGYFARTPEIETAVTAAATYLVSRQTTMAQIMDASKLVYDEIVRLAVECVDDQRREVLRKAAGEFKLAVAGQLTAQSLSRYEGLLLQAIGRMADNPPLEVVGATYHSMIGVQLRLRLLKRDPSYVTAWHASTLEAADAILQRDAARMRRIEKRRHEIRLRLLLDPRTHGADVPTGTE